ncbi:MAG TPA: hypothetical protein VFR39_03650, partial [Burkholderiales bacterium]|nr:hypothetical protein [Burkholderiales bacterium]
RERRAGTDATEEGRGTGETHHHPVIVKPAGYAAGLTARIRTDDTRRSIRARRKAKRQTERSAVFFVFP